MPNSAYKEAAAAVWSRELSQSTKRVSEAYEKATSVLNELVERFTKEILEATTLGARRYSQNSLQYEGISALISEIKSLKETDNEPNGDPKLNLGPKPTGVSSSTENDETTCHQLIAQCERINNTLSFLARKFWHTTDSPFSDDKLGKAFRLKQAQTITGNSNYQKQLQELQKELENIKMCCEQLIALSRKPDDTQALKALLLAQLRTNTAHLHLQRKIEIAATQPGSNLSCFVKTVAELLSQAKQALADSKLQCQLEQAEQILNPYQLLVSKPIIPRGPQTTHKAYRVSTLGSFQSGIFGRGRRQQPPETTTGQQPLHATSSKISSRINSQESGIGSLPIPVC
ncbi:MAG: hypothetical protein A3F17_02855 [Gammaproteobacteria bacterium RIFCSPHIGHO2_12_FULL_41_15]|nr:MAG: hypothetical protein A3F17_02855 [Gammaproteobacteria bacterium RIFCSPHIGHO2_12_FULL_41_15]